MGNSGAAEQTGFHSGFVSILGRPNAGKSTLLNALLESKVAIVSERPQTTRTSIQGVLTREHAQTVFLDTPGIHKPDSLLNKRMMDTVRAALEDRDLLLVVIDAAAPYTEDDREPLDLIRKVNTPAILVLNKVDRLERKEDLLLRIEQYRSLHDFADYIPVSALKGEGLEVLREEIEKRMPEGPAYFPADYVTDQPERFLAAELVREKVLRETHQEVPHSVAVLIEGWEDKGKILHIAATVYVEKQGQKGILIGGGGAKIKRIGTRARQEIERMLDRRVFLELFVKVRPNWREDSGFLAAMDWHSMAGL